MKTNRLIAVYVTAWLALVALCAFIVWHDDAGLHEQRRANDEFDVKVQVLKAKFEWQQRTIDFYRSGMKLQEDCLIHKPTPADCFERFDSWNRVGQKLWQEERELWPSDPNLHRAEPVVVIPPRGN